MKPELSEYRSGMVELQTVTGTVVGANTRTESTQQISSSGGSGGYYIGSVRFDDPVRVTSKTTHDTITEFFLQTPNNKEMPVRLRNVDFPVRDGQTVSLHMGSIPNGPTTLVSFHNHTTGASGENPGWEFVLFESKPKISCLVAILLTLGGWILAIIATTPIDYISSDLGSLAFWISVIGVPIAVWKIMGQKNDVSEQRNALRDDLMSQAAKNYWDEEERLGREP